MKDSCGHGILWTHECTKCNAVSINGVLEYITELCHKACRELERCDTGTVNTERLEGAANALQRIHNVLCNINAMKGDL
jgi:hypothetical protein